MVEKGRSGSEGKGQMILVRSGGVGGWCGGVVGGCGEWGVDSLSSFSKLI